MMRRVLTSLAIVGLAAGVAACAAGSASYPSLAPRPFESSVASAATSPSPAPAPPAPAADPATIAALRSAAIAAHRDFERGAADAERLVRAGAGQSVETAARARALVALAELSSQRGATSAVLADLDLLAVAAASALAPDPALFAAQTEVADLVAREDAALARLWERMGP